MVAANIQDQIKLKRLKKWLAKFEAQDQEQVLKFLDDLDTVDHNKLLFYLQEVHKKLTTKLRQDGFSESEENLSTKVTIYFKPSCVG